MCISTCVVCVDSGLGSCYIYLIKERPSKSGNYNKSFYSSLCRALLHAHFFTSFFFLKDSFYFLLGVGNAMQRRYHTLAAQCKKTFPLLVLSLTPPFCDIARVPRFVPKQSVLLDKTTLCPKVHGFAALSDLFLLRLSKDGMPLSSPRALSSTRTRS